MADVATAVPGFWWLVAGSVAALLGELAILLLSRARLVQQEAAQRRASAGDWPALSAVKSPSRALEIAAALIPLLLAAAFARTIQDARNLLVHALSDLAPNEKAGPVSRAISAELNATPMALLALSVTAMLACVVVGLAVSSRLRARGLERAAALAPTAPDAATTWLIYPGPKPPAIVASIGAFLVLGCGPIVQASHAGVILKIKAFAAIAAAAGRGERSPIRPRPRRPPGSSDRSFTIGRVGVGIAALLATFLAWKFSARRARTRLVGDGALGCRWRGRRWHRDRLGGARRSDCGILCGAAPPARKSTAVAALCRRRAPAGSHHHGRSRRARRDGKGAGHSHHAGVDRARRRRGRRAIARRSTWNAIAQLPAAEAGRALQRTGADHLPGGYADRPTGCSAPRAAIEGGVPRAKSSVFSDAR